MAYELESFKGKECKMKDKAGTVEENSRKRKKKG